MVAVAPPESRISRSFSPGESLFFSDEPSDREGCGIAQNWYAYCSNNPINMVDPTGLMEVQGTTIQQDDVYDAWETETLVSEGEALTDALNSNGFVNYWRKELAEDDSFTLQIGLTGTAGAGTTGTASAGFAMAYDDVSGEVDFGGYFVLGTGMTAGAALTGGMEFVLSDNNSLDDLSGIAHTVGGSALFLTGETNTPYHSSASRSKSLSVAGGLSTMFEGHYYTTNTWVFGANADSSGKENQ